jgi:hypothetical protein
LHGFESGAVLPPEVSVLVSWVHHLFFFQPRICMLNSRHS